MNRAVTALAFATVMVATAWTAAIQTTQNPPQEGDPAMESIQITRAGSKASATPPADYFTGTVRLDVLVDAKGPSRVSMASVTFEPGARTNWHTHPLGQHLYITAGVGRVQQEGGDLQEVRPGDVVWFPPNVKHWHGASPTTSMTHLAVQEAQDGERVVWMERVTDEQYTAAPAQATPPTTARPRPSG